jgi:uncharacterized protein YodC (DUF2158 family)
VDQRQLREVRPDGRKMTVVGFDDVGSAICEWSDEGGQKRCGHVTPSLMTEWIDEPPDFGGAG